MTPADLILPESTVSVLGLALVHFLWQGYLVVFGLWVVLRLLRSASSRIRYGAACGALLTMAVLPVLTVWTVQRPDQRDATRLSQAVQRLEPGAAMLRVDAVESAGPYAAAGSGVSGEIEPATASGAGLGSMMPWFVTFWMAGVALLALRLAGGWIYTLRLRRLSARDATPAWQAMVDRLARVIDLKRPVRVLDSAAVAVPTVVGCLKPLLLLPAAALSGLSPAQVEALVVHELAHIRRHDYIVNVLQSIIEVLLFYHPGVWWVSQRIRIEREYCCDDVAVRACGDPLEYARGLAALEERRAAIFAMAATGGSLPDRIRRVLAEPSAARRGAGLMPAALVMASLLLAAGALVVAGGRAVDSSDGAQAMVDDGSEPSAESPIRITDDPMPRGEAPQDLERAIAGIHAAREHLDSELARVSAYADGLPEEETQVLLAGVLRQLESHHAMLNQAEAEIVSWMGDTHIERQNEPAAERARHRGWPDGMDAERWRHVEAQVEEAIERVAEEMARTVEQWEPSVELMQRLTVDAQRLAEDAMHRVEEVHLSPERLRQIEQEMERIGREVTVRLEESQPMREALQAVKVDAVRMAREASRVAAEISIESEQLKAAIAEVQRMSAEVARQMQSPEWQQRWRDIEQAIEEAVRSLEEHRAERPHFRSDQKP